MARRDDRSSWPFRIALGLALAGMAALLVHGAGYYGLSWEERFDSPLHKALRSSGRQGHVFGYVGLALILTNLLYLVRRRLSHLAGLGSMRAWMEWHVFSGLVGPAFVLLHSALQLRTPVARISAGALAVAVVTGLVGRYLHVLLPRGRDGRPASLEDVATDVDRAFLAIRAHGAGAAEAAAVAERHVAIALGLDPSGGGVGAVTATAATVSTGPASGPVAIVRTVRAFWRLRALRSQARAAALGAGANPGDAARIGRTAGDLGRLLLRADALGLIDTAASSWRALHRIMVVAMLTAASLHVSVAIYLGYVWPR